MSIAHLTTPDGGTVVTPDGGDLVMPDNTSQDPVFCSTMSISVP